MCYASFGLMRRRQHDDSINIQIGIFLGADWTVGDIAQHLGVNSQAVSMRRCRHKPLIDTVMAQTRVAISKYVETRIKAAEDDIQETKKRLHGKSYKLIEKTVNHGLKDEVEQPDQTHLRAAEMGIERTEGRPLDRKAILERNEHVYRIEVDGSDLDSVLQEVALINEMRRKALPPMTQFIDAETS